MYAFIISRVTYFAVLHFILKYLSVLCSMTGWPHRHNVCVENNHLMTLCIAMCTCMYIHTCV